MTIAPWIRTDWALHMEVYYRGRLGCCDQSVASLCIRTDILYKWPMNGLQMATYKVLYCMFASFFFKLLFCQFDDQRHQLVTLEGCRSVTTWTKYKRAFSRLWKAEVHQNKLGIICVTWDSWLAPGLLKVGHPTKAPSSRSKRLIQTSAVKVKNRGGNVFQHIGKFGSHLRAADESLPLTVLLSALLVCKYSHLKPISLARWGSDTTPLHTEQRCP